MIDFFIANIGVPSIRTSLGASFSEIELVIAGYGLTYAVCLITGGRLGDIYGRKVTFIVGMAGFTLTSALCGLGAHRGLANLLETRPRLRCGSHVSAGAFVYSGQFYRLVEAGRLQSLWRNDRFWIDRGAVAGRISDPCQSVPTWAGARFF